MRRVITMACAVLALAGCGRKWNNPLETPQEYFTPTGDNPPLRPSNPSPPDSATSQPSMLYLSWTCSDPDAGDSVSYNVRLDTMQPPIAVIATEINTSCLGLNSLGPDLTYYWQIIATDNHGATSTGPIWCFTTSFYLVPPRLSSPANGDTNIATDPVLCWGAVAGASSYTIQVSGVHDFSSCVYNQGGIPGSSFTASGLDSSTRYYWRVKASDSTSTTAWSPVWQFRTIRATGAMPTTGMVAYYPFSGSANDNSGNGHHGTVYGATLTTDRFDNPDRAYKFDGVDDYIVIPDAPDLDITSALTISAWVRPDVCPQNEEGTPIVCKGTWGGGEVYALDLCGIPTTTLRFLFWRNGPYFVRTSWLTPDKVDHWVHIIAVYDGMAGRVTIYENGILLVANSGLPASLATNNHELSIGGRQGASSAYDVIFDGAIDDIRIYNRALSIGEINLLFLEGGWKRR